MLQGPRLQMHGPRTPRLVQRQASAPSEVATYARGLMIISLVSQTRGSNPAKANACLGWQAKLVGRRHAASRIRPFPARC